MAADYYTISFDHENTHYDGRITPEIKQGNIYPSSWHVVLNEVFFGYMHHRDNQWHVSEQRPATLVQAMGKKIEQSGHAFQKK